MSLPSENDAIQINLSVRVPFRGQFVEVNNSGCSETVTREVGAKPERSEKTPIRIFSVTLPAAGQPHPVKVVGSGRTEFAASGRINAGPPPDEVRLSCGGDVVTTAPDPRTGEWYHAAIPGAKCSHSTPYPSNSLSVQYYRNGSLIGTESVPFLGQCSSYTGSALTRIRPAIFLPTSYEVIVEGFGKPLECFNGRWSLKVLASSTSSTTIQWHHALPEVGARIELAGNMADEGIELAFIKGPVEIRYSKPAGTWIPMNVIEFADCRCRSLSRGASIPAIVHAEPA